MKYALPAALALLSLACANKNVEDYNNLQAAEFAAKIQRESGKWLGVLRSKGEPLAALSITVGSDVVVQGPSTSGVQQVALAGAISVTPADGETIQIGYSGGFYDATNRAFRISVPVNRPNGEKSSIELHGRFSDEAMSGAIWAGVYGDYKSEFTLTRQGSLPSSSSLRTGRTSAGMPTGEPFRYGTTIANQNPLDPAPTKNVELFFRYSRNTDHRFLAFFEPVIYADVQLTVGDPPTPDRPASTVTQNQYSAVIDGRSTPRRFIARADGQATFCQLDCTDTQHEGWACVFQCPGQADIPLNFVPR